MRGSKALCCFFLGVFSSTTFQPLTITSGFEEKDAVMLSILASERSTKASAHICAAGSFILTVFYLVQRFCCSIRNLKWLMYEMSEFYLRSVIIISLFLILFWAPPAVSPAVYRSTAIYCIIYNMYSLQNDCLNTWITNWALFDS